MTIKRYGPTSRCMPKPLPRTIVTSDFDYARVLIGMYEQNTPLPMEDGKLYSIVGYQIHNDSEVINYGGFWGGEPGLYLIRRPATYQFELRRYRDY